MREPKYVDVNNKLHLAFRGCRRGENGLLLVPFRDVVKALEKAKGEDVVPVVRCGNCRFFKTVACAMADPIGNPPNPNAYCSYGEKDD